ncbi:hypothetical protein, partial [Escherichia coli]|uniref:hypothetical protein n=1 Tax=Escherichia coli TaxID=562 RepID=UPI001BC89D00
SLKTSIKTITYLSDIDCLEIQGASLLQQKSILLRSSPLQDYIKLSLDARAGNHVYQDQLCNSITYYPVKK